MVSRPNGKLGKAAALPKFSDTQSRGADYAQPMALPHLFFLWLRPCETLLKFIYFII